MEELGALAAREETLGMPCSTIPHDASLEQQVSLQCSYIGSIILPILRTVQSLRLTPAVEECLENALLNRHAPLLYP